MLFYGASRCKCLWRIRRKKIDFLDYLLNAHNIRANKMAGDEQRRGPERHLKRSTKTFNFLKHYCCFCTYYLPREKKYLHTKIASTDIKN